MAVEFGFKKYGTHVVAVLGNMPTQQVQFLTAKLKVNNLVYTTDYAEKDKQCIVCVDVANPAELLFLAKGTLSKEFCAIPKMSGTYKLYCWQVIEAWDMMITGILLSAEWAKISRILAFLEAAKNEQDYKHLDIEKHDYTCNTALRIMAQMMHSLGFVGPSLALGGNYSEDMTALTLTVVHPLPHFASLKPYDDNEKTPKDVVDWAKSGRTLWRCNLRVVDDTKVPVNILNNKLYLQMKAMYDAAPDKERFKIEAKPVMVYVNGKRRAQVSTSADYDFMCNGFEVQHMLINTANDKGDALSDEYVALHGLRDFAEHMGGATYGGARGAQQYKIYHNADLGATLTLGDMYLTAMQLTRFDEDVLHMTYTGNARKNLLYAIEHGVAVREAENVSRRSITAVIDDDDEAQDNVTLNEEEKLMQRATAMKTQPYGCAVISHITISLDASYSDEELRKNPAAVQTLQTRLKGIINQLPNCTFLMI